MASEEKNYSPEFKREVAQKALDQDKKNLDKLSDRYNVPVSVILLWSTELEKSGPDAFDPSEEEQAEPYEEEVSEIDVDITDNEIAEGFDYGVMKDRLNYRRLIFWSILGIILTHIFVQSLMEMNNYNERITREQHSSNYEYSEAERLNEQAQQHLNSFGVIDLEENIYRIPVDSAISELAADAENE